jgi:hypothetical protein
MGGLPACPLGARAGRQQIISQTAEDRLGKLLEALQTTVEQQSSTISAERTATDSHAAAGLYPREADGNGRIQ